jgi:Aminoglycoside-2''-adenylyltransferase
MDQSALGQLDIIREISDALTCAGVDHWLFGGWAVDFAIGNITRRHRDVDFIAWEVDAPRITGLLRILGYQPRPAKHTEHEMNWQKSGVELQVNLITKTADGSIISPGAFSDWPWLKGCFGRDRGQIGGLSVPIVSPEGQLESKENFPKHPAGQRLRAKDVHDIRQLRMLTRSDSPEAFGVQPCHQEQRVDNYKVVLEELQRLAVPPAPEPSHLRDFRNIETSPVFSGRLLQQVVQHFSSAHFSQNEREPYGIQISVHLLPSRFLPI